VNDTYPDRIDALRRIAADDATLQAWSYVDTGSVARADDSVPNQSGAPLAGMGFGVKDIIDVREMPTRLGIGLEAVPARIDAWCVAALRAAGAVPLGKTHTTAFAWRDPAPTHNPHAPNATPGGSSAGSAAAVAAGHVALALGTQTVGSTLRPAAYCGVVGYKPTYGLVPTFGTSPCSPSVDHIGAIACDVAVASAFAAVFGIDVGAVAVGAPRFGFAPGAYAERIDGDVRTELERFAEKARAGGASVEPVDLPPAFFDCYVHLEALIAFEAHAVLGPWLARPLPPLVTELLQHGATLAESVRRDALAYRLQTRPVLEDALARFDAVLLPCANRAPSREATGDGRPVGSATFYGFPSMSIPIARGGGRLPLSIQLVASHGHDAQLLGAARWLEALVAPAA